MQGSKAGTDVEVMKECCILAWSSRLAQPAYRRRQDHQPRGGDAQWAGPTASTIKCTIGQSLNCVRLTWNHLAFRTSPSTIFETRSLHCSSLHCVQQADWPVSFWEFSCLYLPSCHSTEIMPRFMCIQKTWTQASHLCGKHFIQWPMFAALILPLRGLFLKLHFGECVCRNLNVERKWKLSLLCYLQV